MLGPQPKARGDRGRMAHHVAWERRWYRGHKVWILLDEAGQPDLDDRGHAQLRYKPDDDRTYTVRPAEIRALEADGEPPPARTKPPVEAWVHVESSAPGSTPTVGILLRWRGRTREITRPMPASGGDERAVAAALEALAAIRRPDWPVRVHIEEASRLEAIQAGAGTDPPECGDALRQMTDRFADLAFIPIAPATDEAERCRRLAQGDDTP